MILRTVLRVACVITLISPAILAEVPGNHTLRGRISTEISVFPSDDLPVMICEATVSNIETGEILTQPRVSFEPGQPAKLRSGGRLSDDPKDEYLVLLEVSVGEASDTATYTSTVSVGGEVVSNQMASFKLR